MLEQNYVCHICDYIFRLPGSITPPGEKPACPRCGFCDTVAIASWAPLGSILAEAPQEWEYECQGCSSRFNLPVPRSPSQEKNTRCPYCENSHIHRLTSSGYEPLYCG